MDALIHRDRSTQNNGTLPDRAERWDRASLRLFEGTYGDYLLAKVGKVFPELRQKVI